MSTKNLTDADRRRVYARLRILRDIRDDVPLSSIQKPVARELADNGLLQETASGYIITARGENFVNKHRRELPIAYADNMRGDKPLMQALLWVPLMEQIDRREPIAQNKRNLRAVAQMRREGLIVEHDGQYALTAAGVTRWQEDSELIGESRYGDEHEDQPLPLEYDDDAPADAPAPEPDDSDDLRAMREDVISTIEEIGGKPVAPHVRILRHLNRFLDRR